MTKALIWTRSQTDEAQDRPLLAAVPLPVVHLPCLKSDWLDAPTLPEKPCTGLVVTSPRAVDGIARDPRLSALLNQVPVHAFGTETTARLLKLGARVQRHEVTSGQGLGEILVRMLPPKNCLWVPGAREPAFDLVGHLKQAGFEAYDLPVYATHSVTPDAKAAAALVSRYDSLVVCFASPSAVAGFAPLLAAWPIAIIENLKPCAIGETTARRARAHFPVVAQAPTPDLAALIATAIAL